MMKLTKKLMIYAAAFSSPWFVFFCGGGEMFTLNSGLIAAFSILFVVIASAIIYIEGK